MRFNYLFLLSIFFLFSALCYSGELFDIKAKTFIQENAEILLHLSKFKNTDWSLEYEKMNLRAGNFRREIAVESGENDAELFGQFRWHSYARSGRASTPLGTDKYDTWRKTINLYYRQFFAHMLETGSNQKTTQFGSWTFNFELLTPAVADYNKLLDSLVKVDPEMDYSEADRMAQFPLLTNIHIAVLQVFSNEMFLATYLLAVDTGNANSFRDRASVALKTAFLKEDNAPYTGALIVHSTKKSSDLLREQATSIF